MFEKNESLISLSSFYLEVTQSEINLEVTGYFFFCRSPSGYKSPSRSHFQVNFSSSHFQKDSNQNIFLSFILRPRQRKSFSYLFIAHSDVICVSRNEIQKNCLFYNFDTELYALWNTIDDCFVISYLKYQFKAKLALDSL